MTDRQRSNFDTGPVQSWLDSEIASGRLTGGAIEIAIADETVLSKTFGVRNLHGDLVTPTTQFWIASMTKPIVSVAAMILYERGQLKLDDPVSDFIPGFGKQVLCADGVMTEPACRPATLLDLMTHTSGVTYGIFGDDNIHQRYAELAVMDYCSNNAAMAQRLAALPLLYHPGTTFEYGMSTDLLGRVVEVITGMTLFEALHDLVLGPLGMDQTTFLPDKNRLAFVPKGPISDAIAPPFTALQTWQSGGGGLCSTVSDYMRFLDMLSDHKGQENGCLLSRNAISLICTNHLPKNVRFGRYTEALGITAPWADNGLGFGLGVAVRVEETAHLHGSVGEYLWPGISGANFWVDPHLRLQVVFLTHAAEHRQKHRIQLREAVYAGVERHS